MQFSAGESMGLLPATAQLTVIFVICFSYFNVLSRARHTFETGIF